MRRSFSEGVDTYSQESYYSPDAKDVGPYWLEGIQGSLAEERRNSPNFKRKKLKSLQKQLKRLQSSTFKCPDYLPEGRQFHGKPFNKLNNFALYSKNPDVLNIQLSEFWARSTLLESSISLEVKLQKDTKSNGKKLRSFLIWYIQQEKVSKEAEFLLRLEFDKILNLRVYQESKVFKENFRLIYLISRTSKSKIQKYLKRTYQPNTLKTWYIQGEKIASQMNVIHFSTVLPRELRRKRGYRESHSNKHISRNEEIMVNKSKNSIEIEELRERIKIKQLQLFEKELDRFLQYVDNESIISPEVLTSIYGTEEQEELEELRSTLRQKEYFYQGKTLPNTELKGEEENERINSNSDNDTSEKDT